jgi:hypothetical protein
MLVKLDLAALRQTRWSDYVKRFLFGGAITALAGLIANKFGPGVGGLFLAFPAIFPASASLIQKHERKKKEKVGLNGTRRGRLAAGIDAAGAAMGSVGLATFAVLAWKLLPRIPAWLTLALASVSWAATALLTWRLRKHVTRIFMKR